MMSITKCFNQINVCLLGDLNIECFQGFSEGDNEFSRAKPELEAAINHLKDKEFYQAIRKLKFILGIPCNSNLISQKAVYYLGLCYLELRDFRSAIKYLSRFLLLNNGQQSEWVVNRLPVVLLYLGFAYENRYEIVEAVRIYERCIAEASKYGVFDVCGIAQGRLEKLRKMAVSPTATNFIRAVETRTDVCEAVKSLSIEDLKIPAVREAFDLFAELQKHGITDNLYVKISCLNGFS